MDILKYTKIKTFKLFDKITLLNITEVYSEHSENDLDDEDEPIVVQISEEYYKDEFEVEENGDTE